MHARGVRTWLSDLWAPQYCKVNESAISITISCLVMLRFVFMDFDSIFRSTIRSRFDLVSIFYDLHTSVDPTRFVCGRVWTAVLRCWPRTKLSPHRCRCRRLEQGRCWVVKVQIKQCDTRAEAAKLDSVTAHTNSIHCLIFSLAPCGRCPLSVWTSPTLVNTPTCLRAYNTRGCR